MRADQTLVRVIPLARGCSVRFEAKQVAKADVQQVPGCGYAVYDGQLWISPTAVPNVILTRGVFFDGEKEVELDVSGLADPWIDDDELGAWNCDLSERTLQNGSKLMRLRVGFFKGRANYAVTWIILDGHALRESIECIGDKWMECPEWMLAPKTPQGQYELGKRIGSRALLERAAAQGHAKAAEALKRPVEAK